MEQQQQQPLRKRARKTFSCSFCRRKKKKCDQKKPACSYCIKHNNFLNCDYSSTTYVYGITGDKGFGLIETNQNSLPSTPQLFVPGNHPQYSSQFQQQARSPSSPSTTTMPTQTNRNQNQNTSQNLHKNQNQSYPKIRNDSFIEYDVTKIISASDDPEYNNSIEYLKTKIEEYQNRLSVLESNALIKRRNPNTESKGHGKDKGNSQKGNNSTNAAPNISDLDYMNFFPNTPAIIFRTNCILDIKPLNLFQIFDSDIYVSATFAHLNSFYRALKDKVKEIKLNSDVRLLTHYLPAALNEHFQPNIFMMLFHNTLDKTNLYYELNLNLISSISSAKTAQPCYLNFSTSSEHDREIIIKEIEPILPRLEIILLLWDNFEKYIYPFVPILDLKAFKKDIELILVGLKFNVEEEEYLKNDSYKVCITTFIDLALLSSFLVILRISYLSMKLNPDFLESDHPLEKEIINASSLEYIGVEFFDMASHCLSPCKALRKSSITVLTTIVYIYYYLLTCEESSNSFLGEQRQILFGNMFAQATSIGLYRDWGDVIVRYIATHCSGLNICKENLVYVSRKIWHLLRRFGAQEAIMSGSQIQSNIFTSQTVKLPATKIREDWIHPPDLMSVFTDSTYLLFDDANDLFEEVVNYTYNTKQPKAKEYYAKMIKVENMIVKEYGENPEAYFQNDENFKFEKSNREDYSKQVYFRVLNKVFKFEKYLALQIIKIKVNILIVHHYETNKNFPNWFFFLKQVFKSVKQVFKVVNDLFLLHNMKFLNTSYQRNYKNFNHRLMPIVGELNSIILYFFMGLTYRIYNTVFLLASKINANNVAHNILSEDRERLSILIKLKNICLKMFEFVCKTYFEKVCKFYSQVLKCLGIYQDVLYKLKQHSLDVEKGIPFSLIAFHFVNYVKPRPDKAIASFYPMQTAPNEVICMSISTKEVQELCNILSELVDVPSEVNNTNSNANNHDCNGNSSKTGTQNSIHQNARDTVCNNVTTNEGFEEFEGQGSCLFMMSTEGQMTRDRSKSWIDRRLDFMNSLPFHNTFVPGLVFGKFQDILETEFKEQPPNS